MKANIPLQNLLEKLLTEEEIKLLQIVIDAETPDEEKLKRLLEMK